MVENEVGGKCGGGGLCDICLELRSYTLMVQRTRTWIMLLYIEQTVEPRVEHKHRNSGQPKRVRRR